MKCQEGTLQRPPFAEAASLVLRNGRRNAAVGVARLPGIAASATDCEPATSSQ